MRYEVEVGGHEMRVDVGAAERFLVDDAAVAADVVEIVRGRQWLIRVDAAAHEVTVLTHEPLRLCVDGIEVSARALDERTLAAAKGTRRHAAGRREIRAPMPGLLKAVHVREGDVVEQGAPVVTLEAMKMENELRAPSRGRVAKLVASVGGKVEGGAVLAVIVDAD